jgi:hypothetical protein
VRNLLSTGYRVERIPFCVVTSSMFLAVSRPIPYRCDSFSGVRVEVWELVVVDDII